MSSICCLFVVNLVTRVASGRGQPGAHAFTLNSTLFHSAWCFWGALFFPRRRGAGRVGPMHWLGLSAWGYHEGMESIWVERLRKQGAGKEGVTKQKAQKKSHGNSF